MPSKAEKSRAWRIPVEKMSVLLIEELKNLQSFVLEKSTAQAQKDHQLKPFALVDIILDKETNQRISIREFLQDPQLQKSAYLFFQCSSEYAFLPNLEQQTLRVVRSGDEENSSLTSASAQMEQQLWEHHLAAINTALRTLFQVARDSSG